MPAVLCINPADLSPMASTTLLLSHDKDCGEVDQLLTDEAGTKAALQKQFGRPVNVKTGCLPQGRYAMNLVYGTGQAWSDPNEAGVCAPSEMPISADGTKCLGTGTNQGARPRLPSQDLVLTITGPSVNGYCTQTGNQTPPECCPVPTDMSTPIDPSTGTCKCPNSSTTTFPCP